MSIECRLANMKVTVNCSAGVKKYFPKLDRFVGNSFSKLVPGRGETRSGCFAVDKLNISLALTNMDGCPFIFESESTTGVKEC